MRHAILWLAILGLMMCYVGCSQAAVVGSGNSKSETREVGDFTGVRLNAVANLNISQGDKAHVTIEADDNILPLLKITVRNGALQIDSTQEYHSKSGVKISITLPAISSIELNGVGNISIDQVQSDALDVQLHGSGVITAKGSSSKLSANLAGVGNLNLSEWAVQQATVQLSGSGSIKVDAGQSLDATLSGVGNIAYKNHSALKLTSHVRGVGNISAM
jgi:hypothetical protein